MEQNANNEVVETTLQEVTQQTDTTEQVTTKTDDGYKVDFSKIKQNEKEQSVQSSSEEQQSSEAKTDEIDKQEEVVQTVNTTEQVTTKSVKEEAKENNIELPSNIQKVVEFMNETGGSLEDYVRLNADYNNVSEDNLLREYYKQTKSHLSSEEIDFLLEDNFSYDEELDEDREVRRRKLAYKEAVTEARKFLDNVKDKYYDEVKLSSKLSPDQKEAVEFYNQYKEQVKNGEELTSRQQEHFKKVSNDLFNEEFKGFEFNVGEKKYRYNVKDVNNVKEKQSDLLNVFGTYIKDNVLSDAQGYHKALFAASNPDGIANHFYEQGKADAVRQMSEQSKNININGRKVDNGVVNANGTKVRVVDGDTSSKLKIKLKNY